MVTLRVTRVLHTDSSTQGRGVGRRVAECTRLRQQILGPDVVLTLIAMGEDVVA